MKISENKNYENYMELNERLAGDYNNDCFDAYNGIICFDCGYELNSICFDKYEFPKNQIIRDFLNEHNGHHIVFTNLSFRVKEEYNKYQIFKEFCKQEERKKEAMRLLIKEEEYEKGESRSQIAKLFGKKFNKEILDKTNENSTK